MSSSSYHHGHLRNALLEAALLQIEAEGAQALNLSKLSRQLGVSQPAVYRHFASKQALTFSLVEHGFTLLAQQLDDSTEAVGFIHMPSNDRPSPEQLLSGVEAIVQTYVDFALEHKELARLMFSLKERVTEPTLHATSKQAAVSLMKLIEAGRQHYGLKVDSPEQALRLMWASVHGLAMLLMDEQLPYVTKTAGEIPVHVKAIARLLCEGLFLT